MDQNLFLCAVKVLHDEVGVAKEESDADEGEGEVDAAAEAGRLLDRERQRREGLVLPPLSAQSDENIRDEESRTLSPIRAKKAARALSASLISLSPSVFSASARRASRASSSAVFAASISLSSAWSGLNAAGSAYVDAEEDEDEAGVEEEAAAKMDL